MPNPWIQRNKEGSGNDDTGIEIKPEDIQKALEPKLKEVSTNMEASLDAKLKPISDYIAAQQAREAEADKARKIKEARENQQNLEVQPEDWITDPEGAMDKKLTPLVNTINVQSAIIMRDKTLGKMDYYSSDPSFAAKVDALIDAQPLHLRSNSNVIMNAYKSVFFDEQQNIKEGKIKSQASIANLSNNSTGGHSGSGKDKDNDSLTAEEQRYARKMGLTDEQWISGRREIEYV